MKRKQHFIKIIFALIGGLICGIISNRTLLDPLAFAEKSSWKRLRSIGAEKFVVTDKNGDIRAVLGLVEEAPALMMFGKDKSLPKIMIFDNKGCRIELSLDLNGESSLYLYDEIGTMRTALGRVRIKVPKTDEIQNLNSSLVFFDKEGNKLWSAP
jgi:hypothetical protein